MTKIGLTIFSSQRDHDVVDSLLHAFEAAHVDEGVVFLQQLPELFGVLRHSGLDVHLLPLLVGLLSAHREVEPEVVGVLLLHLLKLLQPRI